MKEFSCLVVVSLLDGLKTNFLFSSDPFTFEPTVNEENGGVYWDCSKTFIVDVEGNTVLNAFKVTRSAIVAISAKNRAGSPDTVYRIGTETVPAKVQLVKHLNKAKLIVKCKMLANPLD